MKILIVDDDPTSRRVLREIISVAEPGGRIVEAANGAEACEQLAQPQHGFDLVFLDLSMPDQHGLDLLARFHESPTLRDLPVVICTSSNDRTTIVSAVAAGARHYIVKPPSPEIVADKIRLVQIGIKASRLPATPATHSATPFAAAGAAGR